MVSNTPNRRVAYSPNWSMPNGAKPLSLGSDPLSEDGRRSPSCSAGEINSWGLLGVEKSAKPLTSMPLACTVREFSTPWKSGISRRYFLKHEGQRPFGPVALQHDGFGGQLGSVCIVFPFDQILIAEIVRLRSSFFCLVSSRRRWRSLLAFSAAIVRGWLSSSFWILFFLCEQSECVFSKPATIVRHLKVVRSILDHSTRSD